VPFATLGLHPDLLQGVRELGFLRPTPIQADSIPPAMEGRDVLACAQTGSGKTAAFLLPILHALMGKPRGTTRALVLAPTRELAAQIHQDLMDLAVHTPITGAAVFGGVGMGPQEHAFRSGVDVIIATPGRLLDHLRAPYAKLSKLEFLVLDEADRMLDMGFLPDIRRILKQVPARRQTLFFSATMPPPIGALAAEMLKNPAMIQRERQATPATRASRRRSIRWRRRSSRAAARAAERGDITQALVFTRTKHRANRLADHLVKAGIRAERIHGNRSQAQRTRRSTASRRPVPVLVATDIAARGIDVEALGHVVNFDVPPCPTTTSTASGGPAAPRRTGEAFTMAAPEEEGRSARHRARDRPAAPARHGAGLRLRGGPQAKLEIPLAERIAEIRARKREERARAPPPTPPGARQPARAGAASPGGARPGPAGPPAPVPAPRRRPLPPGPATRRAAATLCELGRNFSSVLCLGPKRLRSMAHTPAEFTLELTPRARVDVIDVRAEVSARYGDGLDAYPRALCCSFHTTAGYLDQGVAARLNQGPDGVMPYIDVFRTMFPEGAGYEHDKIERRTELSEDQKPTEPLNADSHLAFMAGALRTCVSYPNRPGEPLSFIDLDGVYRGQARLRRTSVLGYTAEERVAQARIIVPLSGTASSRSTSRIRSSASTSSAWTSWRSTTCPRGACGCRSRRASTTRG
jgi:ATP-dependent RNA helicase RhlE